MTPRTMLDSILDVLERDGEVNWIEVRTICRHPSFTPQTSYRLGCRCARCRGGHNAAMLVGYHRRKVTQ